jgi:carboxyl-terminal processing protease
VRRARILAAPVLLLALVGAAQLPTGLETFDAAWTIVRDTHFDKTMNGLNWDAVRSELRPRAASASTPGELRAVIRDMIERLGQSHFALIPSTADTLASAGASSDMRGDPGFEVRLVGRDLLVTRVDKEGGAAAAGVRAGWRLTSIGDAAVTDLLRTLPEGASDRLLNVEAWRIAETRLRGPAGSQAQVTFEDGSGRPVALQVPRNLEQGQRVTIGNLPTMFVRVESEALRTRAGRNAGLIRFNVWMAAVDAPFQEAVDRFRPADGIIIDLRGNPGGLAAMMMGLSGHFIGERKALGVMKTRDNELRFTVNPRLVNAKGERVEVYGGPVAILVDAMTGSASECFAGGMQSLGRARVFGQVSMGQALPALFDRLPNGDVLLHAYGDFVTATGGRLEGRGVVPDQIVPLRREDLLAGRDATLDAALAWVDHTGEREKGSGGLKVFGTRHLRAAILRLTVLSGKLGRPTPPFLFPAQYGQSREF